MAGFKLRRGNQTVAIDSDYFNLALRQKGTVRTGPLNGPNVNVRWATFTVNGDQPILALRAPYPVALTHSVVNGNGTITYTLYGIPDNAIDFDVEFWVFDLPKYGMMFTSAGKFIVRNPASREVVFDSRMKYLKVQGFYQPDNNVTDARDFSRYPAVVQSNRAWARGVYPMSPTVTREESVTSAVWTEGNRVYGQRRNIYYMIRQKYDSDRFISYGGGLPQTMVIDVQDY